MQDGVKNEREEIGEVWSGLVCVVPLNGCELLMPDCGAYVWWLTFANSAAEFRAKVQAAAQEYHLQPLEFEQVGPFSDRAANLESDSNLVRVADELEAARNPDHVRFSAFHTFPRVM